MEETRICVRASGSFCRSGRLCFTRFLSIEKFGWILGTDRQQSGIVSGVLLSSQCQIDASHSMSLDPTPKETPLDFWLDYGITAFLFIVIVVLVVEIFK
jgi:hypothetical protein